MTNEELEALEKLEKAATPGPWYIEEDAYHHGWKGAVATHNMVDGHCRILAGNANFPVQAIADAALAKALRNAAPALIAAARENASMQMLVEEYQMRLAGCLIVAEGGTIVPHDLAYVRNCPTVQAVQRLAAENAKMRAVVEVAKTINAVRLRNMGCWAHVTSPPEAAARCGCTICLETRLKTALSALDAKGVE